MTTLTIDTPRWALPLLEPAEIKGAKGGRSSGKSHERAEALVEALILDGNKQAVCIREIQRSLKFSAKKLIESKIRKFKVSHLFDVTLTEIRRKGFDLGTGYPYEGIIIFQGMQDHTADSIKSLEGFDIAWCEEAQSLSHRSLELLEPTIRAPGSEIWFTWNPDKPTDAVEVLFRNNPDAVLVHVNYTDNPHCPAKMKRLAERTKKLDYEKYKHVWLGGYNTKSEAQVFKDRWRIDDVKPQPDWDGPYYGMDFGFSTDPTCFVRCWIATEPGAPTVDGPGESSQVLYIDRDNGKRGLDLDDTPAFFKRADPAVVNHTMRADSARPESISYLQRHGLPKVVPVKKWPGSVEEGVDFIKTFDEIVIDAQCDDMAEEAREYSYKTDKRTGDILTDIIDDYNHRWDAVRYALAPLIKQQNVIFEAM